MENKHTNKEKNKKIRITCAVLLALLLLFGISGFTVYNAGCKGAEGNATPSDAAVVELTPGDAALAGATPLDAAEGTTEEVTTEEAATEEITTEEVTTGDDTDGADNNQYAQVSDEQTGNNTASGGTQNNSQNKPQTGNAQSQGNTQTVNTTQQTTQQTTTQATTEQSGNAGKTWVEPVYDYVWHSNGTKIIEEPVYEWEYHIICRCGRDFGTSKDGYDAVAEWDDHSHEQYRIDRNTICRGYDNIPFQVQVGTEQREVDDGEWVYEEIIPGHWE